jgi:hypothetical protein
MGHVMFKPFRSRLRTRGLGLEGGAADTEARLLAIFLQATRGNSGHEQ